MISVCLWEAKCFQQCPDGKTTWCVVAFHFHMTGWNPVWETTMWSLSPGNPHMCHALSHLADSAFWTKSRTLASPLNAVARLGIAYKGKLHPKACCCWNTRSMVGHCCCGVKTCHSLVTVMNVSNEHQRDPLLRWRQEQAWLDVLASLLAFWQAGH